MNIQDILSEVPKEKVEQFRKMARRDWTDDNYCMLVSLLEGKTPYQAARLRHESNLSDLSVYTLFYHARNILREFYSHFGTTAEEWLDRLITLGQINGVPESQVSDIQKLASASGHTVKTIISMKIEDRSVDTVCLPE